MKTKKAVKKTAGKTAKTSSKLKAMRAKKDAVVLAEINAGSKGKRITIGGKKKAAAAQAPEATPVAKAEPVAKVAKAGTKIEQVLAMMRREGGATQAEIMAATGWQAHTVRGFVAGQVRVKMGIPVVSSKVAGGERTYAVTA